MDNRTRFGICGLDCMNCSIHLRTEEELNYWKNQNVDSNRIACNGCRSDRNDRHWSRDCTLLDCCFYQKKTDFCGECSDFPCNEVLEWIGGMEHHRIAVEKMKRMEVVGKDNWIQERLS